MDIMLAELERGFRENWSGFKTGFVREVIGSGG